METPRLRAYQRGASESQRLRAVGRLTNKHIVSAKDFTKEDVEVICDVADEMYAKIESGKATEILRGKVVTALFYEPSSRTWGSFLSAAAQLGAGIIPVQGVRYSSSVAKGEVLEDMVRTFERLSHVVIMRHDEMGSAKIAASWMKRRPLINAGDGKGEHPTQALLDLYTIKRELGNPHGLTVTLFGDLRFSRTVHSLVHLLTLYGAKIRLVSPSLLRLPELFRNELVDAHADFSEHESLDDVLSETDVLYVTRVQEERFKDEGLLEEYAAIKGSYVVNPAVMSRAKQRMILTHPFPRIDEISFAVDEDPRAKYFDEIEYGVPLRMALLAMVLGKA